MKNKYNRFQELWSVPKYKTLFKLGGYVLFFVVLFILAGISNQKANNKSNTNNPNTSSISYTKMKTNITEKNLSIKYNISSTKTYYLEGTIINNTIEGTLEENEELKRIKIDGEKKYLITKGVEQEDLSLLSDINIIFLYPENIINILNENSSIMRTSEDQKTFSYTIDNKAFSVFINEKEIEKIVILDNTITYELSFSEIN